MEISTPGKTGRLDADAFCRAHVASIFPFSTQEFGTRGRWRSSLPSGPLDAEGTGRVERGGLRHDQAAQVGLDQAHQLGEAAALGYGGSFSSRVTALDPPACPDQECVRYFTYKRCSCL